MRLHTIKKRQDIRPPLLRIMAHYFGNADICSPLQNFMIFLKPPVLLGHCLGLSLCACQRICGYNRNACVSYFAAK